MHINDLLSDLVIIFLAGVLSVLGVGRIGLPPVVGFLTAGVLIGPHALGLVSDVERVEVIAELGVALLLFTIGLEFSLERLRRIGRSIAVGGTLQVGLTVAGAVAIGAALGVPVVEGVFWGYLAALSSTAIVLRSLSERGETDSPHGRLVVGVLIFQDLCIVPMMLTVPLLAGQGGGLWGLGAVMGRAALVVVIVVASARVIVPRLLLLVARSRSSEVFVLSVLMVAAAVAWATASLGLSIALGAFLAGVVIAETEFVHQVLSEVGPFRDAMASVFFVSIGMLLDPVEVMAAPGLVAGGVLLLVGGKLVLAALAVLLMRFPARVAVLTGVALAQVGEFSFVLLRAGEEAHLVEAASASAFLAASVLTMIASPMLVAASPVLAVAARVLRPLERLLAVQPTVDEPADTEPIRDHVIVAGLGLGGRALLRGLEAAGVPHVAVELNPETVVAERRAGRAVRYGDITRAEVLEHVAHAANARQLVLLLSDVRAARSAAATAHARYPDLSILVRVHRQERDIPEIGLDGVQVVAEDQEAAIEIVERVLRASGAGALAASAMLAARAARTEAGAPSVVATDLAGAFALEAVVLRRADWATGQTLGGVQLRSATGALVVARSSGGAIETSPDPASTLCAGDTLFVVGTREQVTRATHHLVRGEGSVERALDPVPVPEVVASVVPAVEVAGMDTRLMVAVGGPLVVTGLLAFLRATTEVPALVLYTTAVIGAVLHGGARAGLLATLLSFVLANVVFIEPIGELTLDIRLLPLAAALVLALVVGMAMRRQPLSGEGPR